MNVTDSTVEEHLNLTRSSLKNKNGPKETKAKKFYFLSTWLKIQIYTEKLNSKLKTHFLECAKQSSPHKTG